MSPLMSPVALARRLELPPTASSRLVVLDATATLPGERFDPEVVFGETHVPGARRFDIERFSDPDGALPHMVPSQGRFARLIAALGISNDSDVVFYDQSGVASAARAWWLLGLFGHDRAWVLDGGLPAWRAAGLPVEQGEPEPATPGRFVPALRARRLIGLGDMMELSTVAAGPEARVRLLDARSPGRYEASQPEPRAGMRGGHVPGARSLPFGRLLQEGRFRSPEELRALFADAGVGPGDEVVTSCGSGLTAAVLSLGLAVCGLGPGALFDGSWTEWAQAEDLPVAVGAMP